MNTAPTLSSMLLSMCEKGAREEPDTIWGDFFSPMGGRQTDTANPHHYKVG